MNNLNSPEPDDGSDWMDNVAVGRPTPAEVAARRRELAGRPSELRRLEQELFLNEILDARPGAPPPATNFAAQVLARIADEDRQSTRSLAPIPWAGRWRRWLFGSPAWALVAVAVVGVGGMGVRWQVANQRHRSQMVATVATVTLTTSTPGLSAESLEDYEIIRRLGTQAQPGDDALIAALAENTAP